MAFTIISNYLIFLVYLPRVPMEFRVPLAPLVRKAKEELVVSPVVPVSADPLVNVYVPTSNLSVCKNLKSVPDHNSYTLLCAGWSWCSWFPWC